MKSIQLKSPLDMHLHLREGAMLQTVAPLSAETFAGAVIMPNLVPPVDSVDRVKRYRDEILAATAAHIFDPFMTLFFKDYSEAELAAAQPHILGIKLYPAGATTNSEAGVRDLDAIDPTLRRMADLGIPLMVHGETHGFVLDREKEFLSVYDVLATRYPTLRITMEHITTADAVELLNRHENLFATVTLHHLAITLDDVAGGLLAPHLFCKPIAKRPEDRDALLAAALEAHPKLMFGSDSAPHPISKKECCGCAAGVFTAPMAVAMLAELFDTHGALERLQDFLSDNAQRIYGVTPPAKTVEVEQRPVQIPARYADVVPYRADEEIGWTATVVDG